MYSLVFFSMYSLPHSPLNHYVDCRYIRKYSCKSLESIDSIDICDDQVQTLPCLQPSYYHINITISKHQGDYHSPQNLQDTKKLHIKIKSSTSRNNSTGTPISIRQTARQDNLSPFSNLHGGETLIPSSDNLSGSNFKCKWPTPVARTVKFLWRVKSIQPSSIMGFHSLSSSRNSTITLLGNKILHSRFSRYVIRIWISIIIGKCSLRKCG
mmetsp:Transcript_15686/g.22311  ORF Transcript_15686/g.22311 Transcript_15686/m.22311 type:complete len:211 (-) Transcript_15686:234-866(-)